MGGGDVGDGGGGSEISIWSGGGGRAVVVVGPGGLASRARAGMGVEAPRPARPTD